MNGAFNVKTAAKCHHCRTKENLLKPSKQKQNNKYFSYQWSEFWMREDVSIVCDCKGITMNP